jgi:mannose-6-phosphate isomerase
VRRVLGRVQHYDWGDRVTIPSLIGRPADGRPWAEWWWGTHHAAPSDVIDDGRVTALSDLAGPLPFLVKLLAAERPLSLQVHPTAEQAASGFERENRAGLALDDPRRIYRDRSAKPELLCALTEFEALCGIQPPEESMALLHDIGAAADDLARHLNEGGFERALAWVLAERPDPSELVDATVRIDDPRCRWTRRLAELHPDDPTVVLALLLHHVVLQPGDALFLDAGNLHAYLRGAGLEVMAPSDNVVRVGITSKHVDADEALALLDPAPTTDPTVHPVHDGEAWSYACPGAPFWLRRYDPGTTVTVTATGPELWWTEGSEAAVLLPGETATLPPIASPRYRVSET